MRSSAGVIVLFVICPRVVATIIVDAGGLGLHHRDIVVPAIAAPGPTPSDAVTVSTVMSTADETAAHREGDIGLRCCGSQG